MRGSVSLRGMAPTHSLGVVVCLAMSEEVERLLQE